MKKTITLFVVLFYAFASPAQEKDQKIGLKWAPTGLILGNLSLHGEYNFGKNSLTAKIGIPLKTSHAFEYDERDADFTLKAMSFMAGYRTYLSKKHMKGFYFEPFFKYVHHSSEGLGSAVISNDHVIMRFNNDYDGIGVGAQLGVQFLIRKRIVVDLFFFGPEINAARNKFTATEVSNNIPWNSVEAAEAERDILDFIDKFPFIRNKINVMVDQDNKTVLANFKGALPGYRIGVSFGVAF